MSFKLITTRHVHRDDGVSVRFAYREFSDMDEHVLVYKKDGKELRLDIDTMINSIDKAPDGSTVKLVPDSIWMPYGSVVSASEWEQIKTDLVSAAEPLQTKFKFLN